jgi:hypothetical protein
MFRQFSAPGIGPGQKLMTKSFSIKSFMHAANEKAKRAFRAMGILFFIFGFWGDYLWFFLFEGSASFITVHEQFRHKFKLFLILSNF